MCFFIDCSDGLMKICSQSLAHSRVLRPNHRPQKSSPLRSMLQNDFFRMQYKREFIGKESSNLGHGNSQGLRVMTDDIKIIDIPPVVLEAQLLSDKSIQRVEIKIREHLTGQIPDGQPTPRRRAEQTFVRRQTVPIRLATSNSATF